MGNNDYRNTDIIIKKGSFVLARSRLGKIEAGLVLTGRNGRNNRVKYAPI